MEIVECRFKVRVYRNKVPSFTSMGSPVDNQKHITKSTPQRIPLLKLSIRISCTKLLWPL